MRPRRHAYDQTGYFDEGRDPIERPRDGREQEVAAYPRGDRRCTGRKPHPGHHATERRRNGSLKPISYLADCDRHLDRDG